MAAPPMGIIPGCNVPAGRIIEAKGLGGGAPPPMPEMAEALENTGATVGTTGRGGMLGGSSAGAPKGSTGAGAGADWGNTVACAKEIGAALLPMRLLSDGPEMGEGERLA